MGCVIINWGNIDLAISNYENAKVILSSSKSELLRIDLRIAECKRIKKMMKTPLDVEVVVLGEGINSKNDEYAPVLMNDGKTMYFSSRRADNFGRWN